MEARNGPGSDMNRILYALGGLGIVLASFIGTLYLLDRYDIMTPNPVADEAFALREALQRFKIDGLPYPLSPDIPVSELKKQLVSTGHASRIPEGDKDARYVSLDGKSYGLLFHINRTSENPSGAPCLIEVGSKGNMWWSRPSACPF